MARKDGMTIDELARQVGMTVRNVRAHQSRGLLPPPEIRGRTGYYGEDHVARLELIKDLQAEGFTLESIRRLLDRTPAGSVGEVLDFTRAALAPFYEEQPVIVTIDDLRERWGDQLSPELGEKSVKMGLYRPLGDGRFELPSPALDAVAGELARLGVPAPVALDLLSVLHRQLEPIAKAYVRLFIDHVWKPFLEAGEPDEQWPEVRRNLDELRPLAAQATNAVFGLVMTAQVERALERELGRLSGERPDRDGGRKRRRR